MSAPSFFNTLQSFGQFLKNRVLNNRPLVSQEVANARAKICFACHNNKNSTETAAKGGGCSSCKKFSTYAILGPLRTQLIQNRKTPHDASLKTCAICGCENQLQIWFSPEDLGITPETVNAYPTFCWKKDL